MTDASASRDLPLRLRHVTQELEFLDHALLGLDVGEDDCAPSVLREDHGLSGALHLLDVARRIRAELGDRLDVPGLQAEGSLRRRAA